MESSNDILQAFGKRVRELRLKRGLSQEDLAELCNLDRTYISGIERGHRNLGLRNVAVIASALKVTLAEFFQGIG
jgi:transcriptional regulator with XRE-family HTH domain